MSIEGSAKIVYEYRLVLVMRIEVSLFLGEFMGIECASSLALPRVPLRMAKLGKRIGMRGWRRNSGENAATISQSLFQAGYCRHKY